MPETAAAGPGQTTAAQPGLVDSVVSRGSKAENGLTAFTIVTGLIAFGVGWVVKLHTIGTIFAVASMVVGMYAQLMSSTREHRIVIVTGMVAAFVGGALAIAHGGVG